MNHPEKNRRKWTPQRKLQIVLESLQSDQKVAELCRREGLSPTQVYQWRKQLLGAADAVFVNHRGASREDPRMEKLANENLRLKGVIAEITAENIDLKKTL